MDHGASQGGSCTDNCPVYLRLFIAFCALIAFAATAHEPGGFSDFCKGEIGVAIGNCNENTTLTGMSCSVSWSAFNFLIVNGVFIWLWLFVWLAGRHVQAVRDRLPKNWPFVTLLVDANWCLWSMAGACAAASDLNKSICTVPENLNTTLSVQAAEDVGEICATSLYHVCSVKVGGKELHPHDFGCSSISSQLGAGACFTFFMWFAWMAVVVIDYKAWKMGGLQEFNDDLGPNAHDAGPGDGQDVAKYDNSGSSQASF